MSATGGGEAESKAEISVPVVNVSEFIGSPVCEILIVVPPGRNGLSPNLALRLNSNKICNSVL